MLFSVISLIAFPVHAQDICSAEGKSKLRSASVTEAQISRLCPAATSGGAMPAVDYRNATTAMLDGRDLIGKTIYLVGTYIELGFVDGKPAMKILLSESIAKNHWRVTFDRSYNSIVTSLQSYQSVELICRITGEAGPYGYSCDLSKLIVK